MISLEETNEGKLENFLSLIRNVRIFLDFFRIFWDKNHLKNDVRIQSNFFFKEIGKK